jgi:hypothetical protein
LSARILREVDEFEDEVRAALLELMHDLAVVLRSRRQPVQAE